MIRISQLKLPCGHSRQDLENRVKKVLRLKDGEPLRIEIRRHSVDARKKPQLFDIYTVDADLGIGLSAEKKRAAKLRGKDLTVVEPSEYRFPEAGNEKMEKRPVVIGAGPAGLFCALMLAEHGYRPLLLERGRSVDERGRDIEKYWETSTIRPEEAQRCFGSLSKPALRRTSSTKESRTSEQINSEL